MNKYFFDGKLIVPDEVRQKVIKRYTDRVETWSINAISVAYHISPKAIKEILKQANIKLKTSRNNNDLFKDI